jgi:hypothetical protein
MVKPMADLPNDDKATVTLTEDEQAAVNVVKPEGEKPEPAAEAKPEVKTEKKEKIDFDSVFESKKAEVKTDEKPLEKNERERLLDLEFKESLRDHQDWLAKLTANYSEDELKVLEPAIEKLTRQTENPDEDFFDKLGKSGFNVAQKSMIIIAAAELANKDKLNKIFEKRIKDAYENGVKSEQVRKIVVDKAVVRTQGETKGETKSKEQTLHERARKGDKEAMNDPDFLLDDSDMAALSRKRGG